MSIRRAISVRRDCRPSVFLVPLIALVLASTALVSLAAAQDVPALRITSKRYIVIDAETGEIFAQRGARERVAMASLTKVFTTIEALERSSLTRSITTSDEDVFNPESSTVMGFGGGETFTLEDLLYGMMLPSGNDAAHAIARALGMVNGATGDAAVEQFVGYMNQRVRDMGLIDTNLKRPDGWGVADHYSSAYDLAAFTMYALHYPTFVEIISTAQYTTAGGAYTVTNTNRMLSLYEGIIGGKTGFDNDAGYCLIEVARRGDDTMISVTLDGVAPDDWYDDNRVLLDYAFEQKSTRADDAPITGETVSFRDPDAAAIQSFATPGGSFGTDAGPMSSPSTPAPEFTVPALKTPGPSAGRGGISDDPGDSNLLIAVLVAGAVIAAGIASAALGVSPATNSSANPAAAALE